jgi:predicted nucleotidyltransferase
MARKTRLQKYIEILREKKPYLAEQYHIATLEMFGSYPS